MWTFLFEGFRWNFNLLSQSPGVFSERLHTPVWWYWHTETLLCSLQTPKCLPLFYKPFCNIFSEHDTRKRVRRTYTFYTYLNKTSDILPNILGRHICLFYCFYLKALQHYCWMMHFWKGFFSVCIPWAFVPVNESLFFFFFPLVSVWL